MTVFRTLATDRKVIGGRGMAGGVRGDWQPNRAEMKRRNKLLQSELHRLINYTLSGTLASILYRSFLRPSAIPIHLRLEFAE